MSELEGHNPSWVPGYLTICSSYLSLGEPQKAIDNAEKAMRLSPRDPAFWAFEDFAAKGHIALKHDDRAIALLRRSIVGNPQFPLTHLELAAAFALKGEDVESHEMLQRYFKLPATKARTISQVKNISAITPRMVEGLRKAGMPEE